MSLCLCVLVVRIGGHADVQGRGRTRGIHVMKGFTQVGGFLWYGGCEEGVLLKRRGGWYCEGLWQGLRLRLRCRRREVVQWRGKLCDDKRMACTTISWVRVVRRFVSLMLLMLLTFCFEGIA